MRMTLTQRVAFVLIVAGLTIGLCQATVSPSYTTVDLRGSRWSQPTTASGSGSLKSWMYAMETAVNAGLSAAGATDITMTNGEYIRSDTTTAHASAIQVYDVDGTTWRTALSWTNGNTPAVVLGSTSGTLALASSGGLNVSTAGAATGLTTITTAGTGTAVRTDTTDTDTFAIQAYDVDGTTYRNEMLVTNGNSPTLVLGHAYGTTTLQSSDWGVSATGAVTGAASIGFDGGATLYLDLVAVSNAEVKTLYSAPKVLVAAPGAHNVVDVVSVVLLYDYATAAFNTAANNITCKYKATGAGAAVTGAISQTGFIDQTSDRVGKLLPVAVAATAVADIENQPVVLYCATADPTTGGGTMRVQITYRIVPTGF